MTGELFGQVRLGGEVMKIDRFYEALVRRRGRASWAVIAAMLFMATATPSSYGLEFPMTTQLTMPDGSTSGGAFLVAGQDSKTPDQQVAALYSTLDTRAQVSSIDLKMVSLASRQIEQARTPYGAMQVAFRIIRAEYPTWNSSQEQCLAKLWNRESHWNYKAHNYRSGAHGIAQAFPAVKMESVGLDWRTNPVTQIRWGLGYIKSRYGSPCKALAAHNYRGAY